MEPLTALSVASSVFQIADFSTKIISRAKEIYQSADGASKANVFLQDATDGLAELHEALADDLKINDTKSQRGMWTSEKRLLRLAEDSRSIAATLQSKLNRVKLPAEGGKLDAFQQAFRTVFAQKEIDALVMELDSIRKQVDTALLISLRKSINFQSTEAGLLPIETGDDRTAALWSSLQRHDRISAEEAQNMEFSSAFHTVVEADVEKRFCDMILARLHFSSMPQRFENIVEAHKDTFHWVLEHRNTDKQLEPAKWDDFTKWLSNTNGDNVYWIAGKPGSGKSTLMKYLFNHQHTTDYLSTWASGRKIVKAGFFFWNSGTVMQMSRLGLLQTLLYTILSDDRKFILELFSQRWHKFVAFSGGRQQFTWTELRQAFVALLARPTTTETYFFMIDGLDEFNGKHKELVDIVLNAAHYPHVKVCVASRPLVIFDDSFEKTPKLFLEDLTRRDIIKYVRGAFSKNKHYLTLKQLEPERAPRLIEEIATKAAGVFLWVHLVVQSVLDGLSNADRISDLESKLAALPPGLEELYDKLWKGLDRAYFKHSCQLLRLVMNHARVYNFMCSALDLWFADDQDSESAMGLHIRLLSEEDVSQTCEIMGRRLRSRCKCFLEISKPRGRIDPYISVDPRDHRPYVQFIHRTARDFAESTRIQQEIDEAIERSPVDIHRCWMNSKLGMLKSVNPGVAGRWTMFCRCLEIALHFERESGEVPVAYLDEVSRTTFKVFGGCISAYFDGGSDLRSSLEIAVSFNLIGYLRAQVGAITTDQLRHAIEMVDQQKEPKLFQAGLRLLEAAYDSDRKDLKKILGDALKVKRKEERQAKLKKAIAWTFRRGNNST